MEGIFKKTFDKDIFTYKTMKELFMIYNTLIPSSAAIEHMFPVAKDALRPKLSRMSNKDCEMLVNLKRNK